MKATLKYLLAFFALLYCAIANAWTSSDYVYDFEWQEPNNKIEIAVGESHQLQFNCSTNKDKPFTSEYSSCWVHYEFNPMQHVVDSPSGYSIDEKGIITGLIPGSYAIKYSGFILAKSGADKWLYITVVKDKKETESNNTLATANEFSSKIRCGLYNSSDVDYVKVKHNMKVGTYFKFKVHYEGYRTSPFGYKWATFSGASPELVGGGSLAYQDQECRGLITGGNYIYFELYFDQSLTSYFNSGEEFVIELLDESDVKVKEITLNYSSKSLNVDDCFELSATVSPSNATNKSITWSSSDTSVASVSSDGVVTGKKQGNATITAKADDGSNVFALCYITVNKKVVEPDPEPTPSVNTAKIRLWKGGAYQQFDVNEVDSITFVEVGEDISQTTHEYVDLGLPSGTLWATCNVGANSPEEYGDYFAWGETEPKSHYYWDNYKWCEYSERNVKITKYLSYSILDPEDDVATATWGDAWRIPTVEEVKELKNECSWSWDTRNGHLGMTVTGTNGNSIFLPANGMYGYEGFVDHFLDGSLCGNYWSSYIGEESGNTHVTSLSFTSDNEILTSWGPRCYGEGVRPVRSNKTNTETASASIVGTWTEVNGDDRYTFYQDGTGMKYELEDGKWEQDDTDKFKYVYNESKKTVDITRYDKGVQKATINATDVNITAKTMSWKRNGNTENFTK